MIVRIARVKVGNRQASYPDKTPPSKAGSWRFYGRNLISGFGRAVGLHWPAYLISEFPRHFHDLPRYVRNITAVRERTVDVVVPAPSEGPAGAIRIRCACIIRSAQRKNGEISVTENT